MLSLLIPGPKAPGNDIDVFLEPLIDEVKVLWEVGVRTYDAHTKEFFDMFAVLMWTVHDFSCCANVSGWSTKGYLACPNFHKDTCSERLFHGKNGATWDIIGFWNQIIHGGPIEHHLIRDQKEGLLLLP